MSLHIAVFSMLTLCLSTALWATPRHRSPASPDLFEAFRLLDVSFTNLDTEFHGLQDALAKREVPSKVKRPWRHAAREMRKTNSQIEVLSLRLYGRYRRAGRKFGYRSFASLRHQARVLRARLVRVEAAPSRTLALRESALARKSMLDLVLQYQALSGGYAAVRCDAGKFICGEPKAEPRKVGYPSAGVKWACVPRAKACRGILGPRAPEITPEPLTADTKPH